VAWSEVRCKTALFSSQPAPFPPCATAKLGHAGVSAAFERNQDSRSRHTLRSAGGAKTPSFTAQGNQMLRVPGPAEHPREAMFEVASFQVVLEFALHIPRQFPALRRKIGSEGPTVTTLRRRRSRRQVSMSGSIFVADAHWHCGDSPVMADYCPLKRCRTPPGTPPVARRPEPASRHGGWHVRSLDASRHP